MRSAWIQPRRVVVKIGSAVLAREGVLDERAVAALADDVARVKAGVVVVSSGAVASGFRELGLDAPPKAIVGKQAAAAVGQPRLMRAYAEAFARHGRSVAQVLLTAEDIDHRERFINARNTIEALLDAGVVPIVNENDSVSFDEIKLGDNDHLSAMVSGLVGADLLVILSSVAGVWDIDKSRPGAPVILPEIRSLSEGLRHVRAEKTGVGTGGMATKIKAGCTAAALGARCVIADGRSGDIVARLAEGADIGTFFPARREDRPGAARKKWIGFSARAKGTIVVDDGARRALTSRGASLLPGGIRDVHGEFPINALVDVCDGAGEVIARGLSVYSSTELRAIRGRKSSEIAATLGYSYRDEAMHRDDLMLVDGHGLTPPRARSRTESRAQDSGARAAKSGRGGSGGGRAKGGRA